MEVTVVLDGGACRGAPDCLKVKIPGRVMPKDRIELTLWDGGVTRFRARPAQ
jgi:hypothetical protein